MNRVRHKLGFSQTESRFPGKGTCLAIYSRAVNGIAATWLAVWREAHGDTTRLPKAREVHPQEGPPPLAIFLPPREEP